MTTSRSEAPAVRVSSHALSLVNNVIIAGREYALQSTHDKTKRAQLTQAKQELCAYLETLERAEGSITRDQRVVP